MMPTSPLMSFLTSDRMEWMLNIRVVEYYRSSVFLIVCALIQYLPTYFQLYILLASTFFSVCALIQNLGMERQLAELRVHQRDDRRQ